MSDGAGDGVGVGAGANAGAAVVVVVERPAAMAASAWRCAVSRRTAARRANCAVSCGLSSLGAAVAEMEVAVLQPHGSSMRSTSRWPKKERTW